MPGMYSWTVNNALTNISNSGATLLNFADFTFQQHSFNVKRAILAQAAIVNPTAIQPTVVSSYQTLVTSALTAETG
jgi:hypothetical protein